MATLLFAGDLLVPEGQKTIVSAPLRDFIRSHDLASINLEGPVPCGGKPIKKIGTALTQGAHVQAAIVDAGFTLVNAANNHIADFGREGISATKNTLSPLPVVGAGSTHDEAYAPYRIMMAGTRYCIFSLAEWGFGCVDGTKTGGFAWINHPEVSKLIRETRQECDVLIVQAHAGTEGIDIPLPEWRARYRELIDLGVDVVVGHHPHVPQGYEEYSDGLICYSLGNFLFPEPAVPAPLPGTLLSLTFENGRRTQFALIPIQVENHQVTLATTTENTVLLATLQEKLGTPYEAEVAKVVQELWESRYQHFFERSLGGYHTWRGFVRSLLQRIKGHTPDYPLLSHNLNIESHRFLVARAAKLLSK